VLKPLSEELRARIAAIAANYIEYQRLYPGIMAGT